MIGRLSGVLLAKQPPQVLVDVQGVGYEVDVPMSSFFNLPGIGQPVVLLTHFVVREDAQLLYGFLTEAERCTFRELVKISGVGPRTALAILSGLSVAELSLAVSQQDSARLVKVPGIGKKTAERLIVEMRDRVAGFAEAVPGTPAADRAPTSGDALADAMSGLIALGYKPQEASRLVHGLDTEGKTSEAIIREVLRGLAKG